MTYRMFYTRQIICFSYMFTLLLLSNLAVCAQKINPNKQKISSEQKEMRERREKKERQETLEKKTNKSSVFEDEEEEERDGYDNPDKAFAFEIERTKDPAT